MSRDYTMGDVLTLRDGSQVTYVQLDEKSGWPLVQQENGIIVTVNPATIEGGYDDGND